MKKSLLLTYLSLVAVCIAIQEADAPAPAASTVIHLPDTGARVLVSGPGGSKIKNQQVYAGEQCKDAICHTLCHALGWSWGVCFNKEWCFCSN